MPLQHFKGGEDYDVGDVIVYAAFGGERRTVRVSHWETDIKNGRSGFDGIVVGTNDFEVWGYDDQIVHVARPKGA